MGWNPLGEAVSQPLAKAADALAKDNPLGTAADAFAKAADGDVFKPNSFTLIGAALFCNGLLYYYGLTRQVEQQAPAQAAAAQAAAAQAAAAQAAAAQARQQ